MPIIFGEMPITFGEERRECKKKVRSVEERCDDAARLFL